MGPVCVAVRPQEQLRCEVIPSDTGNILLHTVFSKRLFFSGKKVAIESLAVVITTAV